MLHFTFDIPRGGVGATGEATNATLSNAIGGASSNTNGVSTLGLVVSDPPTQDEMQSIVNKVDELILVASTDTQEPTAGFSSTNLLRQVS